jgi:tape measure domain-containing protein
MRQLATNSAGAFNRMAAGARTVSSSLDQLNSKIDDLTKSRNMSINSSHIRRINRELQQLEERRDRLENSGRSGGLGMVGKGLLLGGVALAGKAGIDMVKSGMDRQLAGKSFEVMAGKGDGDKLHKNLIGFATDTIYGNEVFGEAKMMLGFGVAAKNVMPSMKMLGDIAMGYVEHMKSLTLGFSEAASMGKLTGRELLIMADAGFNPLNAMSKMTGKSMQDLRKDVEEGKVSFKDMVAAMEYATGPMGQFHNGMQDIGKTDTGKIIAFQGAMETLGGTIGLTLLPAVSGLVSFFNWMGEHGSLMYGIAAGIGAMTIAWALYTVWVQRAAIWQGILAVLAYWPIAVIGIVIGLAVWAAKSFDGWGKSVTALWSIIKSFCTISWVLFKDFFEALVYSFDLVWLKCKSTFEFIGTMIANTVKAMNLALHGDFTGAKATLTAHITTDADKEIDKLNKARSGQMQENGKAIGAAMQNISSQWKNVGLTKSKSATTSPLDWMSQKFDPKNGGAGGKGAPDGVSDTAKGIAGGGVRNLTINIAKQGIDQITIHAASLTEGTAEIKRTFIEMFNQVVNSGNAVTSPN